MACKFPALASILARSLPVGTLAAQAEVSVRLARLRTGTRLVSPTAGIHRVRRGESLPTIAERYGVPQATLQPVNALPDSYPLHPGMRLRIPG